MKRHRDSTQNQLLAIDVGNTSISFGLFRGDSLKTFRIDTALAEKADFHRKLGGKLGAFRGPTAVASVVPWLDSLLKRIVRRRTGQYPYFINSRSRLPIKNLYRDPAKVGADRIVNASAAWSKFHKPAVVVDFGTATTFDCITRRGEYAGGLIVPGPDLASEMLHLKTAKLPFVKIARPKRLIGKTPKESIQSGLFYGYVSLVDGILGRLMKALGPGTLALSTGGLAILIAGSSRILNKSSVYPRLTLEGIRLIWEMNLTQIHTN